MPFVAILAPIALLGQADAALMTNLLPNPSFESVGDELPADWMCEPGRANAVWEVVEGEGRSGDRCLRVSNPSKREPHVFGRVWTSVTVEPGATYTLSCYVRSEDPGVAWLGAGSDWQFRFPVPAAPEWTRVEGTFVADGPQLPVMFVSESPTPGVYVDDIQLERADRATPFVYLAPPAPGEAQLTIVPVGLESPGANLLANHSFEETDGPLPARWTFSARNTDSTATLDDGRAHSGSRSLKLTNGTAFGAHVYGLLTYQPPVEVEPSTEYTLSAAFLTTDDGMAWIGGGPDWLVRLNAPRTEGRWQRAKTTFRTGPEQTTFDLLISTESPTAGVWIDDLKLERGGVATPYVPSREDAPRVTLDLPSELEAGDTLSVTGWLSRPAGGPEVTCRATLADADGRAIAATEGAALPEGLSVARFAFGLDELGPEPPTWRLTLTLHNAQEAEVARGEADFRLIGASGARSLLAMVRDRAAGLRERLEALRASGVEVDYPLVDVTVLERFAPWVDEDIAHGELSRARMQLEAMQAVADECDGRLARLEQGAQPVSVPRYVTSPLTIRDGAFRGRVQWPDGRTEGDWPVIFTGYGHFGSAMRDIEVFPDYGMNVIQIELGPSAVLTDEDTINTGIIDDYVRVFDRAAEAGVAITLLLSPHYFPEWAYEKWPEVGGVDGGFIRFSVDSPHTRSVHERFLRTVVPVLANHPALHSFCLSNEPIYRDASKDPENRRAYNTWLEARYGTVGAISELHGEQYASFDDVPVIGGDKDLSPRQSYEYVRFNNERFAGWHRWMADIVHELAPDAPVHAKIMNTVFGRTLLYFGVDPELFCGLSQIAGNDCWKYYSHRSGEYASSWQGENQFYDLLRSIQGQPIFNTENHVIPDRDLEYVPPAHIRNILWQSAIHGEGASTMWVWERTYDDKSDFAGSIMHRPDCAAVHGETGLDLLRLGREVNAFQTAPARIAIVYSIASLVYNQDYERILGRTYEALNFTGEKIDFITERQLAAGKADQYEIIVAPGVTHLPVEAHGAIAHFSMGPKALIAVGEGCFGRDDYDRPLDWPRSAGATRIEETTPSELRELLLPELERVLGEPEIRVIDAATGAMPWGVEWQTARLGNRTLVNLTNYLSKPVTFSVTARDGAPLTNLFTTEPAEAEITLKPMEVLLLATGG